ncbi:unnamed protein product [Rotaria sp. Silwood1]|nr:unnamed protein product [Rotaria sp. Silwood1]CAF3455736.1 unnamed protein product [Rotaria sp. Silwood1]CAF3467561.1 unnamed protein product [Rotaria sp. Silwood1]CAF4533347.1 unnamed protein product [Rotaria sp. Silwood1]CAF4627688.1 unnamed protein product [Rotaria sp. Silwood1]
MSPTAKERSRKRRNSLELLQYAKRFQEKYILHQFWIDLSMSKKIREISDVPDVDIGEAGCFKYILIEVRDRGTTYGKSKFVVRGDAACAYHADVLDIMESQIDPTKLTLDCKGGGRIRVDPQIRTISVYGYSMGFGRADHEKTVEILKKSYPEWTIEITDEEY